MTKLLFLFTFLFTLNCAARCEDFLAAQKRYPRVRVSLAEKERIISKKLADNKIDISGLQVLFTAFKDEGVFNFYARSTDKDVFKLIESYKICAKSGALGPKRKQGDLQVPEGFYYIDRFNPSSSYYLSLGINYPNASDVKKSAAKDKGGDIFIHGSCVTIGCLPLTDDKIKEIYLYAVMAKNNGQNKIPVYIFPFKMDDKNFAAYKNKYEKDTVLISFWENLKTGFDLFEKNKKELIYSLDADGDYVFKMQ